MNSPIFKAQRASEALQAIISAGFKMDQPYVDCNGKFVEQTFLLPSFRLEVVFSTSNPMVKSFLLSNRFTDAIIEVSP